MSLISECNKEAKGQVMYMILHEPYFKDDMYIHMANEPCLVEMRFTIECAICTRIHGVHRNTVLLDRRPAQDI